MNARQIVDGANGRPREDTRLILESAPAGVMIQKGETVDWVNKTLLEMIGIGWPEFPLSATEGGSHERLAPLFGSEERVFLTGPDGDLRCLKRVSVEWGQPSIKAHWFLDITREIALEKEREELERRVTALDTQDHETGLLNRQGILAALDKQLTRSRRYGNPLALIRLTLEPPGSADNKGSSTLQALSREFHAQLRWADEVGRLDQSTFLLILPETSEESAKILSAKLEQERMALAKCAEGWKITSVVAAWQKGDDRRKLLSRAGWEPA